MLFKIKFVLFFIVFIFSTPQAIKASSLSNYIHDDTLTDKAFCRLATQLKEARHVVRLEADITFFGLKIITVYTGSAVCIGNGTEFLTNAHCIVPWCDNQGKIKNPLYISSEGLGRKKIIGYQVHEKYSEKYSEETRCYDIAYLYIHDSFEGLEGIEPTYMEPLSLTSKCVNIVGYGANGDVGSWLSRCDGKKRAVTAKICGLKCFNNTKDMPLLYSNFGYRMEYNIKNLEDPREGTLKPIPLMEYEGGSRPGMSGGGVFFKMQYVAIPTNTSVEENNEGWLLRLRRFSRNRLKYLAAVGVPVPFMLPVIGNKACYLILGTHKDWIETVRQKRRLLSQE